MWRMRRRLVTERHWPSGSTRRRLQFEAILLLFDTIRFPSSCSFSILAGPVIVENLMYEAGRMQVLGMLPKLYFLRAAGVFSFKMIKR